MSESRHSKVSAYHAYSSHSKKSKGTTSSSKRRHKVRQTDSDDDVLKMSKPKSLLSLNFTSSGEDDHGSRLRNSLSGRSKNQSIGKTESLMDLDGGHRQWGSRARKTSSSSSEDSSSSSEEERGERWRHSEETNRNRRAWKESSSKHPTKILPLVVDMPQKSQPWGNRLSSPDAGRRPKSLLGTYVPPPDSGKRPKSLLGTFVPPVVSKKSLLGTYVPSQNRNPVSLLDLPEIYDPMGGRGGDNFMRRAESRPRDRFLGLDRGSYDQRKRGNERKLKTVNEEDIEVPKKKMKTQKSSETSHAPVTSNRIVAGTDSKQSFVVIPSTCSTTGIHGRVHMTLLMGCVNILGYQLDQGRSYPVYSPATGGLLSLHASGDPISAEAVKEELTKHGFLDLDKSLKWIGTNTIAVLLVKKLDSTLLDYVTTFAPYTQLFNQLLPQKDDFPSRRRGYNLQKLGVKIAPHDELKPWCINTSTEYEDALNKWKKLVQEKKDQPPVFLCCGAKNAGKSTFSRMLVNSALQSAPAVAYLDCDCGQTEFSPPATLSLHIITEPVLGPPFCHQKQAERMVFFGDVSPSDPRLYIECISYVYKAYTEMSQPIPLVVNTMGWTEGIGLMLLIDTVNITKPDVVVQMESYYQASNLPAITHEKVALDPGWTFNKTPADDPKEKMAQVKAHELVLLMTLGNRGGSRDTSMKLRPVDLRNLSLLSSLSLGLERSMSLTSVPPYAVPYSRLALHVCHQNVTTSSELLVAMDASVVALCVADTSQLTKENQDEPYVFKKIPVCECLGLGVVRSVDTSRGLLYLVTTLPGCTLRRVNALLKGSLTLPDQLILKQKCASAIPYMDALAPSTAVTALRQRSRMPRNSRGNNF